MSWMKNHARTAHSLILIGILLAILLGFQSGCAFKEESGPLEPATKPADVIETIEKGREAQTKNLTLSADEAKLEFLEGEPGVYRARVSWPTRVPRVLVTKASDARPVLVVGISEYSEIVAAQAKVSYGLTIQDSMGVTVQSIMLDGVAPKDLEIRTSRGLEADTVFDFNRVFFFDGGRIITNGYNLTINTKKLFVKTTNPSLKNLSIDRAQVVTHLPGTQIGAKTPPENSKVKIDADYAEGEFTMMMIGADGRNGRSGDELAKAKGLSLTAQDPTMAGAPGRPGEASVTGKPCLPGLSELVINCDQAIPYCKVPATAGENGKKGKPGLTGEDGEDGGDTGTAYIRISSHDNFQVLIYTRPGKPGQPGAGGTGLAGGPGGPPGYAPAPCAQPTASLSGPSGDIGASGKPGRLGRIGPFESSFPIRERPY